MVNANRWGIAAAVAALALGTPALAQQTGPQMGTTGGQRDPGSGTAHGTDSSATGTQGSSGSSDTGTSSSATSASRSASAGTLDKGLSEAIQKLHADNQAEIQMGQMGEQTATSQEVKDYAR